MIIELAHHCMGMSSVYLLGMSHPTVTDGMQLLTYVQVADQIEVMSAIQMLVPHACENI